MKAINTLEKDKLFHANFTLFVLGQISSLVMTPNSFITFVNTR